MKFIKILCCLSVAAVISAVSLGQSVTPTSEVRYFVGIDSEFDAKCYVKLDFGDSAGIAQSYPVTVQVTSWDVESQSIDRGFIHAVDDGTCVAGANKCEFESSDRRVSSRVTKKEKSTSTEWKYIFRKATSHLTPIFKSKRELKMSVSLAEANLREIKALDALKFEDDYQKITCEGLVYLEGGTSWVEALEEREQVVLF